MCLHGSTPRWCIDLYPVHASEDLFLSSIIHSQFSDGEALVASYRMQGDVMCALLPMVDVWDLFGTKAVFECFVFHGMVLPPLTT